MTLDPQAVKAAARAYCRVIGLNYDAISGVLAEKRDEATAAAIRAYQASSIPLVSKLDAETLAELDIQLRKPSSVILPVERADWQDISTAPKDGTAIIGAFFAIRWADSHRKRDIVRCWWQPEFEAFISSCRQMTMAPGYAINGKTSELHSPVIEPITHWMPLPPEPRHDA